MTVIAADGYVHFGDILQLGSCKTGAALALDTEDTDPRPGEYACALSASLDTTPMARNTFLLVKYQLPKGAIPGGAYGPVYDDEVSLCRLLPTKPRGRKLTYTLTPLATLLPPPERGRARSA
jgi:hypothetical protein